MPALFTSASKRPKRFECGRDEAPAVRIDRDVAAAGHCLAARGTAGGDGLPGLALAAGVVDHRAPAAGCERARDGGADAGRGSR